MIDLKGALIDEILKFKNNPYRKDELLGIKLFYIQQIHDDLVLSRGLPIPKLNLELIKEIFDSCVIEDGSFDFLVDEFKSFMRTMFLEDMVNQITVDYR